MWRRRCTHTCVSDNIAEELDGMPPHSVLYHDRACPYIPRSAALRDQVCCFLPLSVIALDV